VIEAKTLEERFAEIAEEAFAADGRLVSDVRFDWSHNALFLHLRPATTLDRVRVTTERFNGEAEK
jgi:hypothetical protein